MTIKLHKANLKTLISVLMVLFFVNFSSAQTTRTSTGNGDWNTPGTWSPLGVPATGDIVIIRSGDVVTVNSTPPNAVASITFNNASSSTSELNVASGVTLMVSGGVSLLNAAAIHTNANISGLGSLICGSLNIGVPFVTTTTPTFLNTLTLTISNLTVTGNITLNNDDNGGAKASKPVLNVNSPCVLSANALIFTHSGNSSGPNSNSYFNVNSGGTVYLNAATPIVVNYNVQFNDFMVNISLNSGSTINYCGTSTIPSSLTNSGTGGGAYVQTVNYSNTSVNASSSITLTSGAGTNIVTTPVNVPILNITYATTGATGATVTGLPPGVSGSWSGGVFTISGTPSTVGVYNYTVTTIAFGTCGVKSATGTITTYVCPTFSLLSTVTSSVNVCLGSSSLVTLTADPANLPVGNYLVSYEIQGVAQTPAVMIVTTAGTGSFIYTGFTSVGNRTITITNIASGLCSSVITNNNMDTVTVLASLAAPTASAGSGATCTQITANWQATTGTTYYELDVSTLNTFATFLPGYNALNVGLETSYTIPGLTSGTTYYYRVRAFNGLCISSSSGTIMYATASAPGTPGNLTTLSKGCDEIRISWLAGTGATSYEVQWSADNFVTILGTATGITSLTYTITGLTLPTYQYRVRSVNNCSQSSFRTSGNVNLDSNLPGQPGAITISGILCNQFTASWTSATSAVSYKIEWATNIGFTTGFGSISGITATNYTITGLLPSTGYYVRVYAENGCGFGNVRIGPGTPNVTTLASAPAAPAGITTSTILCTQFTMSWGASAGATSYIVERASDSGFTTNLVTVTGVLSSPYTFTGLTPGTIYYYRVRAISCSTGANAPATPAFVTTTSTLPATPTVSTSGSLTFCENDSVTLGSSSGTSYLWSTGETTQFIFVTTPGNYSVQVTNASGCRSAFSSPVTVAVEGLPTASAGGSRTICSNQSATINGATATNGTISWTENGAGSITAGATTLTPTYTPAAGDIGNTVTLTLTVRSNNSCAPQMATASYTLYVLGAPSPPTISTITHPVGCSTTNGSVVLTNLPLGGTLNPGNISYSGTSYTYTNLNPGTYNFTVTSGICTSSASDDVVINSPVLVENIWDGNTWSLGYPTNGTERLVFNASYTATDNLKGCSCTVNGSSIVTISSGKNLTLTNELIVSDAASMLFENNASLVQINNNVVNSGNIKIIRTTRPMRRWSYVYGGSPIVENAISQIPSQFDLKYKWLSGTMNGSWAPLTATTPGEGYIARVRNIAPFNTGTGTINFEYLGTPKNGIVDVTVDSYDSSSLVPGNTVLLANPYPSAIDGKKFLEYNEAGKSNIELGGTLFFWTSVTLYSGAGEYSIADYSSWNLSGGVSIGFTPMNDSSNLSLKPNGKIASCQGFFAQVFADGQIHFDNIMRVTDFNSQFFKNSTITHSASDEKNRIWLNLYSNTTFRQMLVGYIDGATDGLDRLYDGDSFSNNEINIYSILDNRKLVIQGKGLPFNENDVVPLGYKITNPGTYSIAIDAMDGVFTGNQNIYLRDNLLSVDHDLKTGPYTFNATAGSFDNRFELRYIATALENPDFSFDNNIKVMVNAEVSVSSSNLQMESIVVYNILGQKLQTYQNINNNNFTLSNLHKNNATLLLKIKLQSGKTVTKKIIY